MAKNKVEIDVTVDDKGTTKKVGLGARQASEGLDKTAKSAQTADRNLKGAAQTSANGTKNFSKMAQGLGGSLVPAYAALAAQIFALSAAFNFLKRAADLTLLQKSQVSYASSSGIAIKTLTTQIQQASKGMLGFQEAAQAAAIGVAKGFSGGQLEKLAVGAGKAAAALGRNYQDAFDRLIRGVSKAEPELLDELGITLRLEDATNRYAQAIGKTRDQLTTAQRSQAVYNETIRQLDQNFGSINLEANPFVQLSKTFEELQQKITQKILPIFTNLADIINRNADAAIAAFGGLAAIVILNIDIFKNGIKSLFAGTGAGLVKIGSQTASFSSKLGTRITESITPILEDIQAAEEKLKQVANKVQTSAGKAATDLSAEGVKSKTVKRISEGDTITPQALGKLKSDLGRVKKELIETGETASKAFAGATVESIEKLERELKDLKRTSITTGEKIKKIFAKGVIKAVNGTTIAIQKTTRAMKLLGRAGLAAGNMVAKGFKLIGKATVILAVLQLIVEAFDYITKAPATLLENIEIAFARIIQAFGFFINTAAKGFDFLANKTKGLFGGDENISIGRVQFADYDRALSISKSVANVGLGLLGTDRASLQITEDKNKNELKRLEKQYELLEVFKQQSRVLKSMLEDMQNISVDTGLKAATAFNTISPGRAATSIQATRDAKAAASPIDLLYLEAEEEAVLSFFERTFPGAVNAIKGLGVTDVVDILNILEGAVGPTASAFSQGMGQIQDSAQNLTQSLRSGNFTEGLSALRSALTLLKETTDAGRVLGNAIGGTTNPVEEAFDRFTKATGIADPGGLQTRLQGFVDRANTRQTARTDISIQNANLGPGAVGRQQSLALTAESAGLDLAAKIDELQQYRENNALLKQEDEVKYNQEIRQRSEEIRLLQEKANVAEQNMTEIGQIGNAIGDSLASSMENAFNGLIQGTMTAKDAFASMAKSILGNIAKMISELLVAKLLTSALGGTSFGTFLGVPTARTGGMFEKVPGYAVGGIAKGREAGYPAILHGTEAVVPLPNGKSIPVEMQKGGQHMNNVTVNVSMDGGGNGQQNSQANGQQGANLGNAIAAAVQKELQNQKRSGGILNPYGVA
jgi:hypothetical protein